MSDRPAPPPGEPSWEGVDKVARLYGLEWCGGCRGWHRPDACTEYQASQVAFDNDLLESEPPEDEPEPQDPEDEKQEDA